MFERFGAEYGLSRQDGPRGSVWREGRLDQVAGYEEFMAEYAGATFKHGAYRVHDADSASHAIDLISDAFPEFAETSLPFGYDWLGRQFVMDLSRVVGGEPQVLLLEPGTGDALEIPSSFLELHDHELVDYSDAALASSFFESWASIHRDSLPLARQQCVAYRVPLFLGGDDTLDNLELSDLEVYWTLCGQLRKGIQGTDPGTSVRDVRLD